MMEFNVHNLVKWFQIEYPGIVRAMSKSSHHYSKTELNPYHLEGDVWTHNMMVVQSVPNPKYMDHNLYPHVLVAALLHDIGKPMARKENHEKKRVNFYSHEPLSMFLAIPILDHIEKDFGLRLNKQVILEAISIHTDVFKLTEEQLAERLVDNKFLMEVLINLANADHHGRFYEMGDRITSKIKVEEKPRYDLKKQVVLTVGLPCSGKSTYANQFKDDDRWVILSRDNMIEELGAKKGFLSYDDSWNNVDQKEVDKLFQARKKEAIKSEKNVIIDMTHMGRKSRRRSLNGFDGSYMKIADVHMTSLQNIYQRNKSREGKTIPEEVFERMAKSFYPPLYDDFDVVEWSFN